MRSVLILAVAAIAFAGPARAKDHDGDGRHGGYERGYDRHEDRRDDREYEGHRDWHERREFEERRRREFARDRYGYARPPAYYPVPGPAFAPPIYAPPGVNLFVPFR